MVHYCRVIGCNNIYDKENNRCFYRLPLVIKNQCEKTTKLSEERRKLWLKNLNQDFTGKSMKNIRICSDHFIHKKKAELFDCDNPDWAPTVNMGMRRIPTVTTQNASSQDKQKEMREKKSDATRPINQLAGDNEDMDFSVLPGEQDSELSTQTEVCSVQLENMEREIARLKNENAKLKEKIKCENPYSSEAFSGNDEKVKYFTGLSCFATLMILFKYVEPFLPTEDVSMGKFECLVMTLSRLRLNLSVNYLSYQLNVSNATISRIFVYVIHVLFVRMKPLVMWPDKECLQKTMPVQFRKTIGEKSAVIIDCFEVLIERPPNIKARSQTWSTYRHHNTVKFLIGILPQGVISFVSKSWGGRTSDIHLTEHCGFLDNILHGDLILADRGFDMPESVGAMCGSVKIHAFTKGKDQLSPLDIEETRKIADLHNIVERVIGHVRQKYAILNSTLPLDLLMTEDDEEYATIDKITHVCCSLVNMCESVVPFD